MMGRAAGVSIDCKKLVRDAIKISNDLNQFCHNVHMMTLKACHLRVD